MRLVYLLVAALLLGLPNLAVAGKTQGEEALALDLSAIPGGPTLFVKCGSWTASKSSEHTWQNCGALSLWQQSNLVGGLQSNVFPYGTPMRPWDPDTPLLP